MWAIRKLKKAGISEPDILHCYFMKICSILESNCVIYRPMLTHEDSNDLERVQKIVLKSILDNKYSDYHQACLLLNIQTLHIRRIKLSLNFGLKCLKSPKFNHLFKINTHASIRKPEKFDVPLAKSSRYFDSPRLYITRLLNQHFRNINS